MTPYCLWRWYYKREQEMYPNLVHIDLRTHSGLDACVVAKDVELVRLAT